jgi:uncharacterized membrane protein YjfL (UPF0719 family)
MEADITKTAAVIVVGAGAIYLIYRGEVSAGVALLGAILGYVFSKVQTFAARAKRK